MTHPMVTTRCDVVAVCIPTYNQSAYVSIAVQSALDQAYEGPLEVWIADDASTDDTLQRLAALAEVDERVKVLQSVSNAGIAANASRVLRAPSADVLIRLDSDDVLAPGYVTAAVAALSQHPRAAYCHAAVRLIDGLGNETGKRHLNRATGFQDDETALRGALLGYRVAANVVAFRRVAIEAAGFYDGCPNFGEDYDLSVRLADLGWGNVYIDELLASYRDWEDAGGHRASRLEAKLEGFIHLFDQTIEPAWRRRGWPLRVVARRRAQVARDYLPGCFDIRLTPDQQARLIDRCFTVSSARSVRFYGVVGQRGGAPLLAAATQMRMSARAAAKSLVRRARRSNPV